MTVLHEHCVDDFAYRVKLPQLGGAPNGRQCFALRQVKPLISAMVLEFRQYQGVALLRVSKCTSTDGVLKCENVLIIFSLP